MAPSNHGDRLSKLPEGILIIIISLLPFKECIRTSVLVHDYVLLRNSFVHYMLEWVSRFQGDVIESFEVCLSIPVSYLAHIKFLVEFAASRRVKNLVLNFSDPNRTSINDAERVKLFVELPICVYGLLTTLESLKIFACKFDISKFAVTGLPRRFTVGWIPLPNIEHMISNSPKLESLIIYYCWDIYVDRIAGNMKEVVLENCIFPNIDCKFDLPNMEIFKYSGQVLPF